MSKKKEKSLQKLSFDAILKKDKLSIDDVRALSDEDAKKLADLLDKDMIEKTDLERDKFLEWIDPIIDDSTRNSTYEYHNQKIWIEIHNYTINNRHFPTVQYLSKHTGLSRNTITKHLKDYKNSYSYKMHKNKLLIMSEKVLGVVYDMAMEHDIKACKLFLEFGLGKTTAPHTYIDKQQNNFNTFLTPEAMEKLTPQQIEDIEAIIVQH